MVVPGARRSSDRDEAGLGRHGLPGLGRLAALPRIGRPIVDRAAGDERDVGARLLPKLAGAAQPSRDPPRPAVVGRRREAEVAELGSEIRQEPRGLRNGLLGVEGVGQPAFRRRAGHELRDSLRAGVADHARAEAALAPDQARQER